MSDKENQASSAGRISDKAAIESAIRNAGKRASDLEDVDSVAGASLGVEGIIEFGRKAMLAQHHQDNQ